MLDPTVAFGQPVLTRLSVSTSVIVDRINAGDYREDLVEDFGATEDELTDAPFFEQAA